MSNAGMNVMNNSSVNFRGTVGKGVRKYIKQSCNEEIASVIAEAKRDNQTVDATAIKSIKEKWDGILDSLKEAMSKAHKDSKIDMHDKTINCFHSEECVWYKNSKLGQERSWETRFLERPVLQMFEGYKESPVIGLFKKIADPSNDKEMAAGYLHDIKTSAGDVRTSLGKFILKLKGKKLENFTKEAGIETPKTSQIIDDIVSEAKKERKTAKQNAKNYYN